jgi:hypothetical protein
MTTQKVFPSRAASDDSACAARLRGLVRAGIEAAPARSVSFRTCVGIALAAILVSTTAIVVAASTIVYGRQATGLEVASSSQAHLLIVLCLLVLLVGSATYASLTRGGSGFGAPVTILAISTGLAVPAYAALVLVFPVHAADPSTLVGLSPWGARCLVVAALMGATVLGTLSAALRHAVPVANRWRGAAVGAAAGLWSGFAVFVFCPASELYHLLIGHVMPIVAFMLLGLIVAPRMLTS